jgi:hypothetical protein
MNDMERRKFEDSFQEAFKDAEVSPSDNVWTNIELDLERAEGGKMKRRLLFFKTLAAASIAFAVFMAGIGYYLLNDQAQSDDLTHQVLSKTESNEVTGKQKPAVDNTKDEKPKQENFTEPADSDSELAEQSSANPITKSAVEEKTERALQEVENANSKNELPDQDLSEQELRSSFSKKIAEANHAAKDGSRGDTQEVVDTRISKNLSRNSFENRNGSTQNSANGIANIDQERIESDKKIAESNEGRTTMDESFEKKSIAAKNSTSLTNTVLDSNSATESNKLPSFYQPKNPELQLPVTQVDPGALLLAKLADEEKAYIMEDKKNRKDKSEKLWTSVGFAAGGFNSPNPSVSQQTFSSLSTTSNNVAAQQSKASGVAYSVGVSVGANLSDRWVLQGGVNYLTQSSDYTANNVIVPDNNQMGIQAESINTYNDQKLADGSSQSRVKQTFPYNVNNNVQFVSVPVQAGYLVINKKFGFQVNAGISTDLFLQNTITPNGGGLTKTTQSRGDDSPYRSLNFSGLMGTELSYKLGHRYRLSLNPGLRYPLNSVYKSDIGVQATPLTFDVGLRFRYIFH